MQNASALVLIRGVTSLYGMTIKIFEPSVLFRNLLVTLVSTTTSNFASLNLCLALALTWVNLWKRSDIVCIPPRYNYPDAEKLEECVTLHLYRSQRFPNRRELVNIALEVGSGNGHVEDLLETYSSPDANQAPCDRKGQDDAAVPYALLVRSLYSLLVLLPSKSIALFYSMERIEFSDKLIRISGNIYVCSVEPIRHLFVRINVFCPKEGLEMIRLWFPYSERRAVIQQRQGRNSTALPTSGVTTRLPELRKMSTVLITNLLFNIMLPAHLTRSNSPGSTPQGKRSMNILDILAYTRQHQKASDSKYICCKHYSESHIWERSPAIHLFVVLEQRHIHNAIR